MANVCRIGDLVVAKCDPEARGYGQCKGLPDGTKGTVIRRDRDTVHEGRWGNSRHFYAPGVYERDGFYRIAWENGAPDNAHGNNYNFNLADKALENQRYQEWRECSQKSMVHRDMVFDNMVRVGDLPDLPFWEGDYVEFLEDHRMFGTDLEGDRARICRIDYHGGWGPQNEVMYHIDYWRPDGSYAGRGSTGGPVEMFKLLERGNVWREAHGLPLEFPNIEAEVHYEQNVGRMVELRNPASDDYRWSEAAAKVALRLGYADMYNAPRSPFSSTFGHNLTVKRFLNREVGERVRRHCMKLYGVEYLEA
jgi:hypothetical protein